jgi:dihydroorotate dehydrogenase (NAD+) catalytic subunit
MVDMPDFSCRLSDQIHLKTPIILASGISGNSDSLLVRAAKSGAAAVTTKSCTLKYRPGTDNPASSDWGCGLITNLGLTNPGVDSMVYLINAYRQKAAESVVPVIANIYADNPDEFAELTTKIKLAQPDIIEFVLPEYDPGLVAEITAAVRVNAGLIPISVKLSAICSHIGKVARKAQDAGADFITAVNPVPGMVIDAYAAKPFLSQGSGWISGPSLKPIALKCISDIYKEVSIPIIGMGGVSSGLDMAEMILAGASAVGIGSALYYRGYEAFTKILVEFEEFMNSEGYNNLSEICGKIWR